MEEEKELENNALLNVMKMPSNNEVRKIVQSFKSNKVGLDIMNVTWEDTGRSAFSCVGPNISDMTL